MKLAVFKEFGIDREMSFPPDKIYLKHGHEYDLKEGVYVYLITDFTRSFGVRIDHSMEEATQILECALEGVDKVDLTG
jgi:hypothetical protein